MSTVNYKGRKCMRVRRFCFERAVEEEYREREEDNYLCQYQIPLDARSHDDDHNYNYRDG